MGEMERQLDRGSKGGRFTRRVPWLVAAVGVLGGLLAWGWLDRSPARWWRARGASAVSRLTLPPRFDGGTGRYQAVVAFPQLSFENPLGLVPLPHTNRLLVLEQGGRIFAIENAPGTADKRLVLDLSSVTLAALDSGLLSLAFHPEFGRAGSANARFAFVQYAYSATPSVRSSPEDQTVTTWRLSRFEVDPQSGTFDPASELVLIAQRDESLYHQGGALLFHPRDGFLYVSVGDEGTYDDNPQHLDNDLFSGVLRIDVDRRGGSISHPIARQPKTGSTDHYFIPNDNPFVGQANALEEFYALGLRNPHRMTYDPVDDRTWIADVGRSRREELDILRRAGNYQWGAMEGTRQIHPKPQGAAGKWTAPLLDFSREDAGCVIGGYVYRGQRNKELAGKYVFGDFVTGNVWALSYALDRAQQVQVRENQLLTQTSFRSQGSGITSFGVDAAGELYFMTMGKAAQIWQLSPRTAQPATPAPPALLSQTGVFTDTRGRQLQSQALPYEVASPFWSDGAQKSRWLLLPANGKVTFSPRGPWQFPAGTTFVKHFAMALDERTPEQLTPLETRLLVADDDGGYYGVTYQWNRDASDAELVLQRKEQTLRIRDRNGKVRQQAYVYPSPVDCLACHNPKAGYVLGVRTEQLSPGSDGDEAPLVEWAAQGVFSQPLDRADLAAPRLAALDDETRSVEDRLRSYWATNCAMCHGVDPGIRARWDARYQTPLQQQGIVRGPLENARESSAVIVPGDLEHSMMFVRGSSTEPGFGMPPLGRRTSDARYLALLQRWIEALPAAAP